MLHLLQNPTLHSGPLGYTEADIKLMPPCFGCDAGMQTRGSSSGSWDNPRSMCDSMSFTDSYGPAVTAAYGGYKHYQMTVG